MARDGQESGKSKFLTKSLCHSDEYTIFKAVHLFSASIGPYSFVSLQS